MKRIAGAVFVLIFLAISVHAADPSERKFLRAGMSEAEVLAKIGNPDSESFDTGGGATVTVKRWVYLPAPGDDQTTTTVVLKNGTVISVTREVTRQSAGASERKFIRAGMSEGEVLAKVGEPDSESLDSGNAAEVTVKRWIYLPAEGDPQTVTTVVLEKGRVTEVRREVSR